MCDNEKSRFIKNQETSGLSLKKPLSKLYLLADILF